MPQDYNNTLNLPQTEFPMRAGLPTREPEALESWYKNSLYEEILARNEGKPLYVLHDGPPYANGNIHIGTALNKIIKDMKPYIELSESTLYTILKRLEISKMLTVETTEHGGRLRKYYHITKKGIKRIEEFEDEWREVMRIYQFVTGEGVKHE